MSREIKFRLHCAETGQILAYEKFNTTLNWGYYWYDATLSEDDQICQTLDYFKHPHPLGKVVRVEFTGLKDKDGVEIYEGDIIDCWSYHLEIVWCNDDASFFAESSDKRICESGQEWAYNCEVIGNVHQHPELLK